MNQRLATEAASIGGGRARCRITPDWLSASDERRAHHACGRVCGLGYGPGYGSGYGLGYGMGGLTEQAAGTARICANARTSGRAMPFFMPSSVPETLRSFFVRFATAGYGVQFSSGAISS